MSGTYLGMPAFPKAAALSTQDTQLRRNLTHATHTIRDKRAKAVAELSDWSGLRSAGALLKDRTLRHLDHYLVQMEEAVTAAGGTVHWAADAAEANRIVADLVKATGETEVVKVKSMATQEIGLNEALAAEGIAAVRDGPGRTDRPAGRRPSVAHPGPRHPPQPRRDQGHLQPGHG